jgi:hypothetical protein
MTAGSQTIGGAKTFSSAIAITAASNQLVLTTSDQLLTITCPSIATAPRTYTIPDAGGAAAFVMNAGTQTIGGAKTFSSAITVTPVTNQVVLGTGTTTTISATAPAVSRTYTIPDAGAAADFILSTSVPAQGDILYYSGTTWVSLVAGVSGRFLKTQGAGANPTWAAAVTVPAGADTYVQFNDGGTAFNGTSDFTFNKTTKVVTANSIVLPKTTNQIVLGTGTTTTITAPAPSVSRTYTIPDAGGAAYFVMTDGNQTVDGAKTFSSAVAITATSNQLVLTTSNQLLTISCPTIATAPRTYTIPDAGAAAAFVMTAGNQTIAGAKTFSSAIEITATTNQLVIATLGNPLTIDCASIATVPRTYTIPDAGGTASFVLTAGTQTIGGAKTLSSALTITPTTNQLVLGGGGKTTTISATQPAASAVYTIPDVGTTGSFVMSAGAAVQGDILYYSGTNWSRLGFGTSGYFLKTQGAGANPTWAAMTVSAVGADTYVQFNDGGTNLGGTADLTFNKVSKVLTANSIALPATSNQMVLGTVKTVTITAPTPANNRIYTVPDVFANASFVMSVGSEILGDGISLDITTVSIDIALDKTNFTVLVDASGDNRIVTLPAASSVPGAIFVIKKIDATANTVTLTPQLGETIEEGLSSAISTQYTVKRIQSDGVEWWLI